MLLDSALIASVLRGITFGWVLGSLVVIGLIIGGFRIGVGGA